MVSIRNKILIITLLLAVVPLMILGIFNVANTNSILKENTEDSLFSLASIKEASLEEYLYVSMMAAESLASTDVLINYLEDPSDVDLYEQAFDVMHSFQESHWGAYHHVFVADVTGEVLLSPPHGSSTASHVGEDMTHSKYFADSLIEAQITDFFGFEETDHYHQLLFYPVKDTHGVTKGVLVFEIEIDHVKHVLEDNFQLGESGEIYLSTLEGIPVVRNKGEELPRMLGEGIVTAQKEGVALGVFEDDNGTDLVGVYLRHSQYPWILVTEITAAEAFSKTKEVFSSFAIGLLVTVLIVILTAIWFARTITNPIAKIVAKLKDIAEGDGDLTKRLDYSSGNELGELAGWFNKFLDNIHNIISQIKINTGATAKTSEDLSASTQEVNAATEQVSNNIQGIAKGSQTLSSSADVAKVEVDSLKGSIDRISTVARDSVVMANDTKEAAFKGSESAKQAEEKMVQIKSAVNSSAEIIKDLGVQSAQITRVVEVINDISEQTNLLALNAAIEAARAGDAGKGFAVVADEVRKLAEESQKATQQIEGMVSGITETTRNAVDSMKKGSSEVDEGSSVVTEALSALDAISKKVGTITSQIEQINSLTDEQSSSSSKVQGSITDVTKIAESSAASSQEVSASIEETNASMQQVASAAQELSKSAAELSALIGKFKTA